MDHGAATSVLDEGMGITGFVHSKPRVSLVIPTYNRARSLRRLLSSLAGIKEPVGGMEVIVVNDGSADDTASVAAQAGVGCITQSNMGRARARDRGWRASRGEIVVFLDDDVVPETDAIDRMVQALDIADGVGARILPMSRTSLIAHYMHVDGIVNHYAIGARALWLITAAAAFRRSALERVNGFDLTYHQAGEDVDLTLRLVEAGGRIRVEPRAVVYHDHRSQVKELWSTCTRYGRAYNTLAARHPVHRAERLRAARARANPLEWLRMYRSYRTDATVRRSLVFLALHAAVAVPYAVGLLQGGKDVVAHDAAPDVELLGFRAPDTGRSDSATMRDRDPAATGASAT